MSCEKLATNYSDVTGRESFKGLEPGGRRGTAKALLCVQLDRQVWQLLET